jgi:hypothetical protein
MFTVMLTQQMADNFRVSTNKKSAANAINTVQMESASMHSPTKAQIKRISNLLKITTYHAD